MRFLSFEELADKFRGRRVALVGSGPSVKTNPVGFVDSYDLVVRVNNFKLSREAGERTDAHYSYYGAAVTLSADFLRKAGVKTCICKCPNSKPIRSAWHETTRQVRGIDFRWIYSYRQKFWFCDTYVPDDARFLSKFDVLERHIPTTGFAALLDLLDCEPEELFMTGFDFFTSGIHNVNERWRPGDPRDPIGHDTRRELDWIIENRHQYPITYDGALLRLIEKAGGLDESVA